MPAASRARSARTGSSPAPQPPRISPGGGDLAGLDRLSEGRSREHAEKCGPGDHGDRRRASWDLLEALWRASRRERQTHCRRDPTGQAVSIEKRGERAGYAGLQTCGSPICPLCGPKIAAERGADIALAITAWHALGGQVALETYTVRHSRSQRLARLTEDGWKSIVAAQRQSGLPAGRAVVAAIAQAERLREGQPGLLEGLSAAWAATRQNTTPRRLEELYSVGWIKRLEVTVGEENGWHPHLHVLRFLLPGVTLAQVEELAEAKFRAWASRLSRLGLGTPSREHGLVVKLLDLESAHEHVAEYVAKAAAWEVASAGTKVGRVAGSRTPVQVLSEATRDGLAADWALWWHYETSMAGRHHIRWSEGLRARLLGDLTPELSDQEAADSSDGAGRLVAALGIPTWRRIRARPGMPATVLEWAEVHEDDSETRAFLARQLARHGLGSLEGPDDG